jgi:two-component system, OmpR family, sensor histidine kinase KdpD
MSSAAAMNYQCGGRKLNDKVRANSAVSANEDDIRATLLAAVSHDLRSPLATATTAVDALADPAASLDPQETVALVAATRIALAQMSRLIDGLLDSARIEHRADTVCLVQTELATVVHAALASVPDAHCVATHLPAEPASVVTDPVLLERVIANVVGNALRFSPPDSYPQLIAKRGKSCVEMRVVDHGPGMSPDRSRQMFQPFTTFDHPGSTAGIGLGLAIARTLAHAIGAEIQAKPTPGGGLTMVIAVPFAN